MAERRIYDIPADVHAEDGSVILRCPDLNDVCMTPVAAEETAERLFEGSMKARGQAYFADDKRD